MDRSTKRKNPAPCGTGFLTTQQCLSTISIVAETNLLLVHAAFHNIALFVIGVVFCSGTMIVARMNHRVDPRRLTRCSSDMVVSHGESIEIISIRHGIIPRSHCSSGDPSQSKTRRSARILLLGGAKVVLLAVCTLGISRFWPKPTVSERSPIGRFTLHQVLYFSGQRSESISFRNLVYRRGYGAFGAAGAAPGLF